MKAKLLLFVIQILNQPEYMVHSQPSPPNRLEREKPPALSSNLLRRIICISPRSTDELICRKVVDDMVAKVSLSVDKSRLVGLLAAMKGPREVYHHMTACSTGLRMSFKALNFLSALGDTLQEHPDGLIQVSGETVLIEIKCPESCRTRPIFDREAGISDVAYLTNTDGPSTSYPDIRPASPSVILECYPEIQGPLMEILKLSRRSTDELICRKVVDDMVAKVSLSVDKSRLVGLLAAMKGPREVYHHMTACSTGLRMSFKALNFLSALGDTLQEHPDGLIQVSGETVLIEIKCPESCRTRPIFDREAGISDVAYLTNTDGELSLEPPQPHYTQVQVQLYVLNLK
ncbi:hypothetical protein ISCGN_011676 [Ixodes scapularis]